MLLLATAAVVLVSKKGRRFDLSILQRQRQVQLIILGLCLFCLKNAAAVGVNASSGNVDLPGPRGAARPSQTLPTGALVALSASTDAAAILGSARVLKDCEDNINYVDQMFGDACYLWEGYSCEVGSYGIDEVASAELKAECCQVGRRRFAATWSDRGLARDEACVASSQLPSIAVLLLAVAAAAPLHSGCPLR